MVNIAKLARQSMARTAMFVGVVGTALVVQVPAASAGPRPATVSGVVRCYNFYEVPTQVRYSTDRGEYGLALLSQGNTTWFTKQALSKAVGGWFEKAFGPFHEPRYTFGIYRVPTKVTMTVTCTTTKNILGDSTYTVPFRVDRTGTIGRNICEPSMWWCN